MIMKYEVNKGTLAVLPNDEDSSLVYEDENRYLIHEKAYKIMDDSCKYFGSTYEGRKNGSKEILGAEYKVPIIVEDSNNLIVFEITGIATCDANINVYAVLLPITPPFVPIQIEFI